MNKPNEKPLMSSILNVDEVEKRLPPKNKRSHHAVVQLRKIEKEFKLGIADVEVLKGIDLTLYAGEFVVIYGPSGCGKSTLLHTMLGLEAPDKGEVFLRGENLYDMNATERTNFRREKIGMVFQQPNWIKSLSVWENVAYPLYLNGSDDINAKQRATEMLEELGMSDYANQKPMALSGGQQQRVALARALAVDPWVIMADEPTGNLDTKSSADLIEILARLNRERSRTVIMVTHEINFLPIATRRVGMMDGAVVMDEHD
jgi:ABC-type lipoprotein export system ATPase subunit